MFRANRSLVFLLDVALVAASLLSSFLLRFDFRITGPQWDLLGQALAVVLVVKPALFAASGIYRSIWRYASLQDAYDIFKVATVSSLLSSFLLLFLHGTQELPLAICILDWAILFSLVAASRLGWRVYRETRLRPSLGNGKRTLIIGAGEAGNLMLKELRKEPGARSNVVGFVDDDPEKRGLLLSGIRVLGGTMKLRALIKRHRIEEVIFAIPSADGALMRRALASCEKAKTRFRTLPRITDLVDSKVAVSQLKDVEIEDLLGREPVVLDQSAIRSYLTGKPVLVNGAAGSIGSEICRQVALFHPSKIVVLDHAETALFYLERELAASFPDLTIIPVIADVKNQARIEGVFADFRPEVVFHAAAYKHVAMMEYNPAEAVLNNVLGSRTVADAAHKFRTRNFVLISTDKAVNPTNVMGATKRVAEMYVQALAAKSGTKFTTVRFGNVLGSNGSVIPIFKEQIRKGGPVTVTDKDVVRYFMTIPEASQLVLQAGCIGKGGEIFVLDMGEPVRILTLAEELIRLSGFTPYKDVDIAITGLKPGEKLYEELLIGGEGIRPTSHKKIRVMAAVESDLKQVGEQLAGLFACARSADISLLVNSLRDVVPEFVPSYHFEGAPASHVFQRVRPDLFPLQKLALVRTLQVAGSSPSEGVAA
jgi:FlaA1/EpsC-like NDP-sugar epimerase